MAIKIESLLFATLLITSAPAFCAAAFCKDATQEQGSLELAEQRYTNFYTSQLMAARNGLDCNLVRLISANNQNGLNALRKCCADLEARVYEKACGATTAGLNLKNLVRLTDHALALAQKGVTKQSEIIKALDESRIFGYWGD